MNSKEKKKNCRCSSCVEIKKTGYAIRKLKKNHACPVMWKQKGSGVCKVLSKCFVKKMISVKNLFSDQWLLEV